MALAALLLVGTLGGCSTSGGENGKLVLYTWENMFPQEVLDGFTQETGISVTYSNFDTDETMLARLEAAEGGDYDLVIADDYIIETAIQEGLVQELDTSKLENYGSINPVYQGQFYDPENKYTVPYGAGVQTIVYDPSAVDVEIKGYADLWDASLEDNLGIIDNFRVVNGMALKVLGESYNTEDTAAIEAAGDKLLELAPNIRLIKDQNTQDDLLSGEVGRGGAVHLPGHHGQDGQPRPGGGLPRGGHRLWHYGPVHPRQRPQRGERLQVHRLHPPAGGGRPVL